MPDIRITPQTTITFYKGINFNKSNTINFASRDAQATYFAGKASLNKTGCTYQRETQAIKVNATKGTLNTMCYLSFFNVADQRTYYCFIIGMEYRNEATTFVYFEVDYWQTYITDFSIPSAFIERTHTATDGIGEYLKDEGLAYGPYVTNNRTTKYFTDWWLVVESSVLFSDETFPPAEPWEYMNIYSGVALYCYEADDLSALETTITALEAAGKLDAIIGMYMVPGEMLSGQSSGHPMVSNPPGAQTLNIPKGNTLDGYTPKNNKLYTYPFRALMVHNNQGNAMTLRYEFMDAETMSYTGSALPNGSVILKPTNYEGVPANYNFSVSLGNYPACCWLGDVYANWNASQTIRNDYIEQRFWNTAAQSGINSFAGSAESLGAAAAIAPELAVAGAAMNVGTHLVNTGISYENLKLAMAEEKEIHSIIPPAIRGTVGDGNTNISIANYGFVLEERSITKEYAKSIDDYFTVFGYKVDKIDAPNINSRPAFNYLKCHQCVVSGNIPSYIKNQMEQDLMSGMWFWHGDYVGNFSINNQLGG